MSYRELLWSQPVTREISDTLCLFNTLGASLLGAAGAQTEGITFAGASVDEIGSWQHNASAKLAADISIPDCALPRSVHLMPISLRSFAVRLAVMEVSTKLESRPEMTSHLRTGHMQTLQALEADFLNDFPGPDLRLWILPEHSDFIRLSGGRTGSSGEICLWDADASEWTWRGFEVATTVEDKPEALAWFADFSSKTILHLISSPHDPRRVATWKQLLAGSAPGEYDV